MNVSNVIIIYFSGGGFVAEQIERVIWTTLDEYQYTSNSLQPHLPPLPEPSNPASRLWSPIPWTVCILIILSHLLIVICIRTMYVNCFKYNLTWQIVYFTLILRLLVYIINYFYNLSLFLEKCIKIILTDSVLSINILRVIFKYNCALYMCYWAY